MWRPFALTFLMAGFLFASDHAELCRRYKAAMARIDVLKTRTLAPLSLADGKDTLSMIAQSSDVTDPRERAALAIDTLKNLKATGAEKAALWQFFSQESDKYLKTLGGEFFSKPFPTTKGNLAFHGKTLNRNDGQGDFVPIILFLNDGSILHAKTTPKRLESGLPIDPIEFSQQVSK